MSDPVFKPRLPSYNVKDGQQILTKSGNVYEYNLEKNEWVCVGIIPKPDVASESNDGLVTPDVYRKLKLIQELIDRGFDFSYFKLDSEVPNPYYYFFYSSDDLIKFSPERDVEPKEVKGSFTVVDVISGGTNTVIEIDGVVDNDYQGFVLEGPFGNYDIIGSSDNTVTIGNVMVNILVGDDVKIVKPEKPIVNLRIEIDKGRLYQKLLRNCCVGPKGPKGDKGDKGRPGIPADLEIFHSPISTDNNVFAWSSIVNTPIDTPISLRMFKSVIDKLPIIEIIYPLDGSNPLVVINDGTIGIDETSFEVGYDVTSKTFYGSVKINGASIDSWRYKVRQKGPKGRKGKDGTPFLEVVSNLLDDPSVRSVNAIVSLRKGVVGDDIVVFKSNLFENISVSSMSVTETSSVDDISSDHFVAVNATINNSKDIGFYKFIAKDFDVPPLDMPLWTPTGDCVQAKRWAQYRFDWFSRTEPDYLYSILLNPKPADRCCQDDFFFCPNVGDNPCGVLGDHQSISSPKPVDLDCQCECENPLAGSFSAGGYALPPIDMVIDSSGFPPTVDSPEVINKRLFVGASLIEPTIVNSIDSVIDGSVNKFIQDITMVGNGEVIISLDYDSNICGGKNEERKSRAFVESDSVLTFISLIDKDGFATISSDGVLESNSIPSSVGFTVSTKPEIGSSGVSKFGVYNLRLEVDVNTTKVDYCRGYRLVITVVNNDVVAGGSSTITDLNTKCKTTEVVSIVSKKINVSQPNVKPLGGIDSSGALLPVSSVPSFAPSVPVISGGLFDNISLLDTVASFSSFAQSFPVNSVSFSGSGNTNIFIGWSDIGVGSLIKSPSNVSQPLVFDGLQDNVTIRIDDLIISKNDAGYDSNGPFGVGTYIIGTNFASTWSNRSTAVDVRKDIWSDVVIFIGEFADGKSDLLVLARLSESVLLDSTGSVYATDLFSSKIVDGVLAFKGVMTEDPMRIIADGSISFGSGELRIGYFGNGADSVYPNLLIGNSGVQSQIVVDPIISGFVISPDLYSSGAVVNYNLSFNLNVDLPVDARLVVDFTSEFDISSVDSISSSSIDGTFTAVKSGSSLVVRRSSDGSGVTGDLGLSINNVVNPSAGTYTISFTIQYSDGSVLAGPSYYDVSFT